MLLCVYISQATGRWSEVKSIHVKVKVKLTLEKTTKAQRGSRGIALLCL